MIKVRFVEICPRFEKIIRLSANESDCEGLIWDCERFNFMTMGFVDDCGWECDEFGVGLGKVKMV